MKKQLHASKADRIVQAGIDRAYEDIADVCLWASKQAYSYEDLDKAVTSAAINQTMDIKRCTDKLLDALGVKASKGSSIEVAALVYDTDKMEFHAMADFDTSRKNGKFNTKLKFYTGFSVDATPEIFAICEDFNHSRRLVKMLRDSWAEVVGNKYDLQEEVKCEALKRYGAHNKGYLQLSREEQEDMINWARNQYSDRIFALFKRKTAQEVEDSSIEHTLLRKGGKAQCQALCELHI